MKIVWQVLSMAGFNGLAGWFYDRYPFGWVSMIPSVNRLLIGQEARCQRLFESALALDAEVYALRLLLRTAEKDLKAKGKRPKKASDDLAKEWTKGMRLTRRGLKKAKP
jgi:hypothetical protein